MEELLRSATGGVMDPGELASASCAILWAFAVILFRKCGESVGPIPLNFFKGVVGLGGLLVTLLLLGFPLFPPEASSSDWLILLASGAVGIGVADSLFFASLNRLGAGNSAIVDCLYSPFVVLCSFLWLREPLPVTLLPAVGLMVAAILIGTWTPKRASTPAERRNLWVGALLGVVSMAIMAAGIVAAKPVLNHSDPLWAATVRLAGGVALLLFQVSHRSLRAQTLHCFRPSRAWRFTIPGAVIGAYLAMILWVAGMSWTQTNIASVLNQSSSVFVLILGAIFLGERLTLRKVVAIVLALVGGFVVTLPWNAEVPPATQQNTPIARPGRHPPAPRLSQIAATPRPDPLLSAKELDRLPNFVIIDIDSLRGDRIRARRDTEPIAPSMAALADRGVEFTQAISQSGWTLPSVTSLLTGGYPPLLAVDPKNRLPWLQPEQRTLPEILGYYGYHTATFWGWTVPASSEELSRGFQFVGNEDVKALESYRLPVKQWLSNQAEEPFFLFIHNIDLHVPYPPYPVAEMNRWTPDPSDLVIFNLDDLLDALLRRYPREEAQTRLTAIYDAHVSFADSLVASIVEMLDREELRDNTVIILTSNHGEVLFEHGAFGHGRIHYKEVLAIPLVWVDPRVPGGQRIDSVVQTMDLAPTILERAGLPVDRVMEGQSFLPLLGLSSDPWTERDVYSLTNRFGLSLRTRTHKLLRYSPLTDRNGRMVSRPTPIDVHPDETPIVERLYDLGADPGETRDVSGEQPEIMESMSAALHAFLVERAEASRQSEALPTSDAFRKTLQERGYWEHVSSPSATGGEKPAAK